MLCPPCSQRSSSQGSQALHSTLLWMGIIQKLLSKWCMSLCTLQEVWALVANIFCHPVLQPKCSQWHVRITHDGMFTAPAPQAKFFHNVMVMLSRSKGLIIILLIHFEILQADNLTHMVKAVSQQFIQQN